MQKPKILSFLQGFLNIWPNPIIEIINDTSGEVVVDRKVKNKIAHLSKGNPGAATALTNTYLSEKPQE